MSQWTFAIQVSALTLSLLWLVVGLRGGRPRSPLAWLWLLFCASTALFSLKRLCAAELGAAQYLIGLGACFTCNAFWLVSRGLFRAGPEAIGRLPLLFACSIAGLLMLRQLLEFTTAIGGWSADTGARLSQSLGELTGMLGSTVLALAFWEGVRGWHTARAVERRVRTLFLVAYGGCVLSSGVAIKLFAPTQQRAAEALLEGVALLSILLIAQALVWWRLKHPLVPDALPLAVASPDRIAPAETGPMAEARALVAADRTHQEEALAVRLEALMRERQLFLEPELKLIHLAQELDVSEYRISRAITGALGERNINRWLNRLRIEHAKTLLRDPRAARQSILDLALASGFASLGPFNRSFKEHTGMTPGAYRADAVTAVARALEA